MVMTEYRQNVLLSKEQKHAIEMIESLGRVRLEVTLKGYNEWKDLVNVTDEPVPFNFIAHEYRVKQRQPKPLEPILIKRLCDERIHVWQLVLLVKLYPDGCITYKHPVSSSGEMSISEVTKCEWKYVLEEE